MIKHIKAAIVSIAVILSILVGFKVLSYWIYAPFCWASIFIVLDFWAKQYLGRTILVKECWRYLPNILLSFYVFIFVSANFPLYYLLCLFTAFLPIGYLDRMLFVPTLKQVNESITRKYPKMVESSVSKLQDLFERMEVVNMAQLFETGNVIRISNVSGSDIPAYDWDIEAMRKLNLPEPAIKEQVELSEEFVKSEVRNNNGELSLNNFIGYHNTVKRLIQEIGPIKIVDSEKYGFIGVLR